MDKEEKAMKRKQREEGVEGVLMSKAYCFLAYNWDGVSLQKTPS